VRGLAADTGYRYRLFVAGREVPRQAEWAFRTAPDPAGNSPVRIAFGSCAQYTPVNERVWDTIRLRRPDAFLTLGDNVYIDLAGEVNGLHRYTYYCRQSRPEWRRLTAGVPIYAIWDDHDFGPDNSDGTLKGKERALQTFQEHWANPAYGEPDNPGIYSKFTRGGVEFFLVDVRYHRDPNKATNLTDKTMLGTKQLAWIKRELLASKAPVKILVSGSEWQSNGTDDSWSSFKQERDNLFRFIEDQHITGVLLISGDRHFTGAYHVKGRWIEVTAGPIGSSNAKTKNLPEMFLNLSDTKAKFYCIYDIDTTVSPPKVTLEVYRVGEGLAERRTFTWDEVLGLAKIPPLPTPPKPEPKPAARADAAKPGNPDQ
jgi:alkaline phosphatase D